MKRVHNPSCKPLLDLCMRSKKGQVQLLTGEWPVPRILATVWGPWTDNHMPKEVIIEFYDLGSPATPDHVRHYTGSALLTANEDKRVWWHTIQNRTRWWLLEMPENCWHIMEPKPWLVQLALEAEDE